MKLFQDASYRFIEKRRTAYVLSAIVLLLGIGAMVLNVVQLGSWQNYGVDFEGGSLVQVQFSNPVDPGDIRSALGPENAAEVTSFGAQDEYLSRGYDHRHRRAHPDACALVARRIGMLPRTLGEGSRRDRARGHRQRISV